jgi:tetratricopeptide (TPR) repeat protein
MLLSPWNYWTDGKPRSGTESLLARLERVQRMAPEHPGGCHFYIHAVEAVYPERAVACADRLARLMPGAGHLVHMPAHIYVRVGRYADAIRANEHAVHADEAFITDRHPEGLYPLGYYPHNYHFLEFAAQMAGQAAVARAAAGRLQGLMDPAVMTSPGFEMLQHFYGAPLRVAVRFGDWDAVLAAPPPPENLTYARATRHWARAMAFARRGDPAYLEEVAALRTLMATPAVGNIVIWGINGARQVLEVGLPMVLAAAEESAGRADRAVSYYEEAMRLEDALLYDEPPTWELPVRPYLGAALLAAGRPADAERVYREDLAKFRENGWSLFGLAAALEAQGKTTEADAVRSRFAAAWAAADVTLNSSRF